MSYGGSGSGVRAVEQLRQVIIELQMASVPTAVMIPFIWSAFGPDGAMIDGKYVSQIDTLLTDLSWWTHALKNARTNS